MKTKRLIPIFSVIFLVVLYLFPAVKGGIRGTIIDKNNNPLEGIILTIISVDYPSEKYTLKTNKKGRFIQIGLEPGYYELRCITEGYNPAQELIKVPLNEIVEAPITLHPLEQQVKAKEIPGNKELNKANLLFNEGKYEESIIEYQKAIEIKPEDVIAYYNLGVTFMALDKKQEAIEAFMKAIEIQPVNSDALKNLGQVYGKMKNYKESLKYYSQAVKISADDPETFFNLGISFMNLAKYEEAVEAFLKSIECQENYADSYYQLGLLYLNQNKLNEAKIIFEKFIKIVPDDPKVPNVKNMLKVIKIQ